MSRPAYDVISVCSPITLKKKHKKNLKLLFFSHLGVCQTHLTHAKFVFPLQLMALRVCVCSFVSMCLPVLGVCVCIGRQVEHPFCYHCRPFISRSGSSAWILFPWLIISAVQWRRTHQNAVENGIIIQVWGSEQTLCLFCLVYITFPSEISKEKQHIPAQQWFGELVGFQAPDRRLMKTSEPSGGIIGCSLFFSSHLSWQGPVCMERNSDTCRTTLRCWKEKASLWGICWFYTCSY